jgi:hypothetical protein
MRSRARRLLFVAAVAGVAAVASAVATPSALAHGCPPTGRWSTPFTAQGDSTSYVPVLFGGGSSVTLQSGSSVTSGDTCGPFLRPVVRFFVDNVGSGTGLLHVEVLVNDGRDGVLDGGTISASSGWNVTGQIVLPRPAIHPGAVAYAVRLTPVGDGAAFDVQNVYIDPYQSR